MVFELLQNKFLIICYFIGSYEKAQRRRLFAQQRKLLAKSDRPCCHNYRPWCGCCVVFERIQVQRTKHWLLDTMAILICNWSECCVAIGLHYIYSVNYHVWGGVHLFFYILIEVLLCIIFLIKISPTGISINY